MITLAPGTSPLAHSGEVPSRPHDDCPVGFGRRAPDGAEEQPPRHPVARTADDGLCLDTSRADFAGARAVAPSMLRSVKENPDSRIQVEQVGKYARAVVRF